MAVEVRRAQYADLAPFAALATREGAVVKPSVHTDWWAAFSGTRVLSFGGLHVAPPLARLKALWTRPEERRSGLNEAIVDAMIQSAWARGDIQTIEVFQVHTGSPDYWPSRGFTLHSVRRNGARVYRLTKP